MTTYTDHRELPAKYFRANNNINMVPTQRVCPLCVNGTRQVHSLRNSAQYRIIVISLTLLHDTGTTYMFNGTVSVILYNMTRPISG